MRKRKTSLPPEGAGNLPEKKHKSNVSPFISVACGSSRKKYLFFPSLFSNHPMVGLHEDSNAFMYLSGLREHPLFKGINALKKFKICLSIIPLIIFSGIIWCISFLFKVQPLKSFDVELILKVASKLGMFGVVTGIENMMKQNEKTKMEEEHCNNPQEPSQDTKKLYIWALTIVDGVETISLLRDGWSTTKYFDIGGKTHMWSRKRHTK